MSQTRTRWGVISTGRIADQFAQDMAFVERSQIIACASRTRANAKLYQERHRIPTLHDDYHELLANPEIDAVYVASPHTFHFQHASEALHAGKAVLCEKPLVVSVEECEKLINIAQKTRCYLMEAMWTWFLPAIAKARQWVTEGRIGNLIHFKADFGYPQRPYSPTMRVYARELGGGAMLDMGIYPVALSYLFFQRQPKSVQAIGRRAPNGVDDDVSAILDFGDATATLGTSFRCKLPNFAYLIGDEGWIAIPDFWRASRCELYKMDSMIEGFSDERKSIGLNYETAAVSEDLAAGRSESAIVPLKATLACQKILAEVRQQLEQS